MEVGFRPLQERDLPLVHEWLGLPHGQRWWGDRGSLEQTVDHYGPSLDGRDPTDLYAIVFVGRDVGMIQTYLIVDYPEWEAVIGVGDDVAGLDLFIAEAELV